jgi:hypothetical protein
LSEPDSDEETFVEYLAEIIGKIANGLEPSEISSVLRDNVLIAAPKSNGDVRPFWYWLSVSQARRNVLNAYFGVI